jgi:hypothetical protein
MKAETPVYRLPAQSGNPVNILHLGNWVGVIERRNEWVHVIGIHCEGWVRAEDLEERPPLTLHALWSPGKPVEYVSSPST